MVINTTVKVNNQTEKSLHHRCTAMRNVPYLKWKWFVWIKFYQ